MKYIIYKKRFMDDKKVNFDYLSEKGTYKKISFYYEKLIKKLMNKVDKVYNFEQLFNKIRLGNRAIKYKSPTSKITFLKIFNSLKSEIINFFHNFRSKKFLEIHINK